MAEEKSKSQKVDQATETQTSEALCVVLGNTLVLAETTLNFRWNVTGHLYPPLHAAFGAQADELWRAADRLGERIRELGAPTTADKTDALVMPCAASPGGEPVCEQMLCVLAQAHEAVVVSLKAGIDVARDDDDEATVLILAERILAHQTHLRLLNAASAPL